MHFTCRSFIGKPINNSWSQYWENEPDDSAIVSRRGHLFGLVSFSLNGDSNTSAVGHQLISDINQQYYSSTDLPVSSWLKQIGSDFIPNLNLNISDLSLILAVVINQQLHLMVLNGGYCFLNRSDQISLLLTGTPDQVQVLSGPLQDADRLFLTTSAFYQVVTWEKIKSFLSLKSLQDIEENFLSHLYSLNQQPELAAALIDINTDPLDHQITAAPIISSIPSPVSNQLHPHSKVSFLKKIFSSRPTFVSHHSSSSFLHRRKINFFLSLLILVALSFSIFFGYRQNQRHQADSQYQKLKSNLDIKLNNASTLKNINLVSAQNIGKEAETILSQMTKLKIHLAEIDTYRTQIQTLLSQTGDPDSYQPKMFYDTSLIVNKPHYSQIYLANNSLYLFDPTSGRVDLLDINKTSTQNIVNSDQAKNAQFIAENNGTIYILKDKAIYQAQKSSLDLKINLNDSVKNFSSGSFHFWNGSLYLLALSESNPPSIWKYSPFASGFSSGVSWLKPNQRLPDNPVSFAINGQIWVISSNGSVAPFTLGIQDQFQLNAAITFSSVNHLTTSYKTDKIAFTDKDNLVYVIGKNGQKPLVYNLGNLKIQSLVMSTDGLYLYALCSDQKIYQITL